MKDNLHHELIQALKKAQDDSVLGYRLEDWRVTVSRAQIITLGIKNNAGGSVYTPPAFKNSEHADVYLVWQDGKCSKAKVQKPFAGAKYDWNRELKFWRMAAFEDPYSKTIPYPAKLPEVRIASDEIKTMIESGNRFIFDQQGKILSNRPQGAQTGANIMALWGRNSVFTSTGINVTYNESRYAVSWSFDSQIARGYAKRRMITESEWQELWDESISRYEVIKNQAEPVHKKTVVILAPSVVEQMAEQYILSNFNGENIVQGQSKFTQEDFIQNKKVFHEGISMEIDPLRPYQWTSYLLTSEGIPALYTALVLNGVLCSPILNAKYGLRWGILPTAIPYGAAGIRMRQNNQIPWTDMLKGIDDGILVLSVLGLHTQNPVSGSFSLAVPSGLRIKNGHFVGKADIRINGSYWDILNSPDTACGISELDNCPYLLTPCLCENL
ncbi:MAG: PmbA/TldD family protein [Peptococcaceae bacterium]|nr:PmbA/TldD family protein [Peptococcaceae bacterium]